VSPPAEQTFWLATAAGVVPLTLNWQADNGDFALVLANADDTPAVAGAVKVRSYGNGSSTRATASVVTGIRMVNVVPTPSCE
jgi:hypothetical protein